MLEEEEAGAVALALAAAATDLVSDTADEEAIETDRLRAVATAGVKVSASNAVVLVLVLVLVVLVADLNARDCLGRSCGAELVNAAFCCCLGSIFGAEDGDGDGDAMDRIDGVDLDCHARRTGRGSD
mmetsp:Transcript_6535/g.16276  ORF Transcript_6535/g.16276 Transcript_6535/m.16276 type:complete len:127 (+) Transcript_6535:317-697(+)